MMRFSVLFVSLLASANAFTAPMRNRAAFVASTAMPTRSNVNLMMAQKQQNEEESSGFSVPAIPAMTAAIWASLSTSALADSPNWGVFEGRIGSLLHPLTMGSLLVLSVSTALLGFDWRRQRTIGDDISELKKSIPALGGASSVAEALTVAKAAESPDNAVISKLQAALSVEDEIKAMQAERKELSAKGPRDKHFNQGVTLAFIGTVFAIEVCKNGLLIG
jgi:predicted lipid-binding transport protein (Tim44 family)